MTLERDHGQAHRYRPLCFRYQVPKLPVVMPLAFTGQLLASIAIEGAGSFDMSGNLRYRDSHDPLLNFGAKADAKKSGSALIPFKFPAVKFERRGPTKCR